MEGGRLPEGKGGWPKGMRLDEFDIKILAVLQGNGRITKLKLAEAIGLSPSPCWERMRRLEEAGYIRGYHAEIDLSRIVRTSTVFVEVSLKSHEAQDFARFERAVQGVPEVVECYAIGGGIDYLLKVVTTDIADYQQLIDDLLQTDIGISRYFTYIVTKPIKSQRVYPLKSLLARGQASAPAPQK
jgi:Lrp/AsnC family transcriptional regulator, regulator of ectoine-degradation genes